MSLLQSTSLPSPISTVSRLLNFFLQRCCRIKYIYIYIYPIKSVNTLRCQTYPILFSSRQPNVSAHLPEKWFAQHAQNLPWNSDRAKDIDIPLLPSNHDLYRNTLYPLLWVYLDAYPARIKQLPIWNTAGNLWKPLSTLPEEIHISKFEDL